MIYLKLVKHDERKIYRVIYLVNLTMLHRFFRKSYSVPKVIKNCKVILTTMRFFECFVSYLTHLILESSVLCLGLVQCKVEFCASGSLPNDDL